MNYVLLSTKLLISSFCANALFFAPTSIATLLEFEVSTAPVIGSTLEVNVVLNDAFGTTLPFDSILSFGFDVNTSDDEVLGFTSAIVADPFVDLSQQLLGTDVAGAVFPGIVNDGTNDTVLLATLMFDVLSDGTSSIEVVSDMNNLNHGLGFLFSETLSLYSDIDVSVPPLRVAEPSKLSLIIIGIFSIVFFTMEKTSMRSRLFSMTRMLGKLCVIPFLWK